MNGNHQDDNAIWVLTFHYYDDCAEKDSVFLSRTKKTAIDKAVETIFAVNDFGEDDDDCERNRISGILDQTGIYDDGEGTSYVIEKTVVVSPRPPPPASRTRS